MLQGLFATETIEDYTCSKCSIRNYLKTEGVNLTERNNKAELK